MLEVTECMAAAEIFFRIHEKMMLQVAERYSLNKTEIKILLFLHQHPELDTAKAIAETWQIPKSCVSKAIDGLEKKGYLEICVDQQDRRMLHLTKCPRSAPVLDQILGEQRELARILSDGMSENEKRMVLKLGEKLILNMNDTKKALAQK